MPRFDPPAVLLVHGEARSELLRGVLGWGQYQGRGQLLAGEGPAAVALPWPGSRPGCR